MSSTFSHLNFKELESVNNPNSIHGIYPYRGKISAIDAKKIIKQLPKDMTLLDPFCGSGTILYEAQKHGLKVIGVDQNPLAYELSKSKIELMDDNLRKKIINTTESIIKEAMLRNEKNLSQPMPEEALKAFHVDTSREIMSVSSLINDMDDYIRAAYYGAIALTARGCNDYKWTSSTVGKNIEPKRYINFYEKFMYKVKKHIKHTNDLGLYSGTVYKKDSRLLSEYIPDNSIDIVFTSPPYFDALDYTAYYGKLIYGIHSINRLEIKKDLIQNVSTYKDDMHRVLKELNRVTKDESLVIFIVGDRKRGKQITNGGDFFSEIWAPSYILEREYSGTSSQVFDKLNKTKRKEQIVVWEKEEGEVLKYGKEFHTEQQNL